MSDKDNGTSFAIGFIVGAVIGMAVGFLYAPRPGEEMRAMIREKAGKTKEKAEEIIEEARERAKRIIADAKGKAAEIRKEYRESSRMLVGLPIGSQTRCLKIGLALSGLSLNGNILASSLNISAYCLPPHISLNSYPFEYLLIMLPH